MISAKTKGAEDIKIEIEGNNAMLFFELVAVVDSVSRVIFKRSEKDRIEFLKDLPEIVLKTDAKVTATQLPFSPGALKKFVEEGGND